MTLTRQVSGGNSINGATQIENLKTRAQQAQRKIDEKVAMKSMLENQFEQLKKEALELGVEDINKLKAIITENNQQIELAVNDAEAKILEVESVLNGGTV